MSVTLNSTLQTAQDGINHRPILELISTQFASDKPFDGSYFNTSDVSETESNLIYLSSGRLAAVYIRDNDIYYKYTDTDRLIWSEVEIVSNVSDLDSVACVELSGGNVGVVWIDTESGYDRIRQMTVGPTGSTVVAASTIATFATASYSVNDVHIGTVTGGDHWLVYRYYESSGETYSLRYRTSTDFSSWGSEQTVTLSGLTATRRKGNPFLIQHSTGGLLIFFDYVDDIRADGAELVNVYQVRTINGGTSWETPEKITNYTVFGESGYCPTAGEKSDASLMLAWHKQSDVLHMDKNTTGWSTECTEAYATDLHFDPATGYLYCLQVYTSGGTKKCCGVVVVDTSDWTVDKVYNTTSSPAYSGLFAADHVQAHRHIGAGHYVPIAVVGDKHVAVINHQSQTITHYNFDDDATYSLTQNVNNIDWHSKQPGIVATQIDAANDRLYVCFVDSYLYRLSLQIGYIDLTEAEDPVSGYSWNECIFAEWSGFDNQTWLMGLNSMRVVPEQDYIILSFSTSVSDWTGRLLVYQISSGGLIYDFNPSDYAGFPYRGALYPVYHDGHIYASIDYESGYGNSDRRGLLDINLASESITYQRPTYATIDDYDLRMKTITNDGRIIMAHYGYGVAIYTIADGSWELFDNTELQGMTEDSNELFGPVAYDESTDTIFTAQPYAGAGSWFGILAFNEIGAFRKGQYLTGAYSAGWSWGSIADLNTGIMDYDLSIAIDGSDVAWATWTRQDTSEYSLKWDKEGLTTELTDYVTGSVRTKWRIDGPSQLTFSLAQGYLFDPSYFPSTLHTVAAKGRRMQLSLGETVSSTDYLQAQGEWIITETKLTYQRGDHPILEVTAEDKRNIWGELHIVATEYFDDQYPEAIIEDLITTHTDLESSDLNLPTMTTRHKMFHQFVDMDLMSMLEDMLAHFDYFAHFETGGDFTLLPVAFETTPDHTYSSAAKIINYSPDDSYSSFVNRVTVTGEGRYFLEVLYNEEAVGETSGTVGWWGGKQDVTIWYSEDHERTCRDPRLEVIQSVRDFEMFIFKGGGGESISSVDPSEKYCVVTIDRPNLVGVFIATIASVVAVGSAAISCTINCGGWIYALAILLSILLNILGAVAQYAYVIWAKPIGHERQQLQATADDTDHQREMGGYVIEQRIDDPFADTVQICQAVADRELALIQNQRRRVRFGKSAHLQDEIGDTIRIPHPQDSSQMVDVFVTELERHWEKGAGVNDKITGWRRQ